MDNEEGKDHEDYDEKNLRQLLQSFDNNVDINSIILILNRFLSKHSKKLLDKENLVINLYSNDLDKFVGLANFFISENPQNLHKFVQLIWLQ